MTLDELKIYLIKNIAHFTDDPSYINDDLAQGRVEAYEEILDLLNGENYEPTSD